MSSTYVPHSPICAWPSHGKKKKITQKKKNEKKLSKNTASSSVTREQSSVFVCHRSESKHSDHLTPPCATPMIPVSTYTHTHWRPVQKRSQHRRSTTEQSYFVSVREKKCIKHVSPLEKKTAIIRTLTEGVNQRQKANTWCVEWILWGHASNVQDF